MEPTTAKNVATRPAISPVGETEESEMPDVTTTRALIVVGRDGDDNDANSLLPLKFRAKQVVQLGGVTLCRHEDSKMTLFFEQSEKERAEMEAAKGEGTAESSGEVVKPTGWLSGLLGFAKRNIRNPIDHDSTDDEEEAEEVVGSVQKGAFEDDDKGAAFISGKSVSMDGQAVGLLAVLEKKGRQRISTALKPMSMACPSLSSLPKYPSKRGLCKGKTSPRLNRFISETTL